MAAMKERILTRLKYPFSFAFFCVSGLLTAKKNLSKPGFKWCWQYVGKAIPNTFFRQRCTYVHEYVHLERKAAVKQRDSTPVHGYNSAEQLHVTKQTKLVLQALNNLGRQKEHVFSDLLRDSKEILSSNFMTVVTFQVTHYKKVVHALLRPSVSLLLHRRKKGWNNFQTSGRLSSLFLTYWCEHFWDG